MAQTALQKAIQKLQSKIMDIRLKMSKTDSIIANGYFRAEIEVIEGYIKDLTDLLPYERETIESAHKDWQFTNAENYFTKTYNQND
jgi:hypothetical protein